MAVGTGCRSVGGVVQLADVLLHEAGPCASLNPARALCLAPHQVVLTTGVRWVLAVFWRGKTS
jgi:hypothetical protein